jgi:hypothetical protein
VPRAEASTAALVVPGLWEWLWRNRIREFEHDPRLIPALHETAKEREVTRQHWVNLELKRLKRLGIAEHPLVCDRSVQWQQVNAGYKVTVAEGPP